VTIARTVHLRKRRIVPSGVRTITAAGTSRVQTGRMRTRVWTAAVTLLAAAACQHVNHSEQPAAPTRAALEIAIAPDPLRILWVCPPGDPSCYGTLDAVVTIVETAGVGGRLDSIEFVARERTSGAAIGTLRLSSAEIQARAGTDRLGPMGRVAVRPIIEGYPVSAAVPRPQLDADVAVQLTDDQGNVVQQSRRVPIT
jgi:hypothetical protein